MSYEKDSCLYDKKGASVDGIFCMALMTFIIKYSMAQVSYSIDCCTCIMNNMLPCLFNGEAYFRYRELCAANKINNNIMPMNEDDISKCQDLAQDSINYYIKINIKKMHGITTEEEKSVFN